MAKRSVKSKGIAPITAVRASERQPTTFLSLPAELRLQVYSYLLPDHSISRIRPDQPLRSDGQTCSTNFMASCKQVYGETANILYGDGKAEAAISGWHRGNETAHVSFLNQKVALTDAGAATCFHALRQVKELNLYISTGDVGGSVCDVQDMLFRFLKPLSGTTDHQLRAIDVRISVGTGRDDVYGILSSNAAERYARIDTMQEFRHIKPGDLSRAHLTAFLTDPLRTLRGVKDGKKKGRFALSFIGETGNPWKDIPRTIRSILQGSEDVPDYEPFSRYYDVLRPLLRIAEPLVPNVSDARWKVQDSIRRLAQARIGGKALAFRSYHESLTSQITELLTDADITSGGFSAEEREIVVREATYLLLELERMIPEADLDTSFFGYNESDDKLAAWQAGRGQRRREKKEKKRKRAQEDGGEGGGKKKRGGGYGGGRGVGWL